MKKKKKKLVRSPGKLSFKTSKTKTKIKVKKTKKSPVYRTNMGYNPKEVQNTSTSRIATKPKEYKQKERTPKKPKETPGGMAHRASLNQNAMYLSSTVFGEDVRISWDEMNYFTKSEVSVKGQMLTLNTLEHNGRTFAFYENELYEVIDGELNFNEYVSYADIYGA